MQCVVQCYIDNRLVIAWQREFTLRRWDVEQWQGQRTYLDGKVRDQVASEYSDREVLKGRSIQRVHAVDVRLLYQVDWKPVGIHNVPFNLVSERYREHPCARHLGHRAKALSIITKHVLGIRFELASCLPNLRWCHDPKGRIWIWQVLLPCIPNKHSWMERVLKSVCFKYFRVVLWVMMSQLDLNRLIVQHRNVADKFGICYEVTLVSTVVYNDQ